MIGLLLIYFIGKYFYNLAKKYNKRKWGYALLGIGFYYAGTILGAALLGLVLALGLNKSLDEYSSLAVGFMSLPFGILSCWGMYQLLKRKLQKTNIQDEEILDLENLE